MSKFYHPAYIGFDRLWTLLEDIDRTTIHNNGYPPYNLIRVDENKYLVEMAVAGVPEKDINVVLEENLLTISSSPPENDGKYIHRGIANRSFTRKFTLADTVEIRDVVLENGMLRIHLENVIPEAKKPRKLEIRAGNPQLLVEKNENSQKVLEKASLGTRSKS